MNNSVFIRLIILVLVLCTACERGLIPCPSLRTTKAKHYRRPLINSKNLSARANDDSKENRKNYKSEDTRVVKSISVEEWNCPKPGEKKVMPRSVKENIRKNLKKVKSAEKAQPSLISK
jgi:sortase (surface protein transpeptidase)